MEFARMILAVAKPAEDDDAFTAIFDAFVLTTLGLVASPERLLADAAEVSPTAAAVPAPLEKWHVPQALELARIHAIQGNELEALRLMRRFAALREPDMDPATDWYDEAQVRRANTATGLARTFGLPLVGGRYGHANADVGVHQRPGAHLSGAFRSSLAGCRRLDDCRPLRRPCGIGWTTWMSTRRKCARCCSLRAWQLYAAGELDAAREVVAGLERKSRRGARGRPGGTPGPRVAGNSRSAAPCRGSWAVAVRRRGGR